MSALASRDQATGEHFDSGTGELVIDLRQLDDPEVPILVACIDLRTDPAKRADGIWRKVTTSGWPVI